MRDGMFFIVFLLGVAVFSVLVFAYFGTAALIAEAIFGKGIIALFFAMFLILSGLIAIDVALDIALKTKRKFAEKCNAVAKP